MKLTLSSETFDLTPEQEAKVREILKPKQTKEELFASFVAQVDVNRPVVDFEKYPTSMFWFNTEGKLLFEYAFKNGYFWINYDLIWSVFEPKFNMVYSQVQEFMRGMVEEHLKLEGITPWINQSDAQSEVEEHLKLEGITPGRR